jgi:hypothetical protein
MIRALGSALLLTITFLSYIYVMMDQGFIREEGRRAAEVPHMAPSRIDSTTDIDFISIALKIIRRPSGRSFLHPANFS